MYSAMPCNAILIFSMPCVFSSTPCKHLRIARECLQHRIMDQALLCLFVEETVERSYPPDLGTLSGGQSGLVHKTNVGETDPESGTHKFTQNETFQPLFIPVLYFLHWATMIKDKLLTLRHFELKMLNHQPSSWFPANTHPHTPNSHSHKLR